MKIIYCIASVYNPGGMERVLLNKVRWLSERDGYEVAVVTTDQQGRPPFYAFPEKVQMTDLGINYSVDNGRAPIAKILSYFRKRRQHRKALTELLLREKADILVSLYPSESSFIPSIHDGSKKVLELHYCKFFRLQYGRSGLLGLADRFRTRGHSQRRPAASRRTARQYLPTRHRRRPARLPEGLRPPTAGMGAAAGGPPRRLAAGHFRAGGMGADAPADDH